MSESSEPRLGVSWAQVAGSALAAVSTAVLLSTLGVAGTLVGAAVGSVIATITTALYTRTLDVSHQQVAAQAAALRRVTRARDELDDAVAAAGRGGTPDNTALTRAGRELDAAEEMLAQATPMAAVESDPTSDPTRDSVVDPGSGGVPPDSQRSLAAALLSSLSWKRLAVAAGAVFVVAMVAITGFELATGRAVSTYTGGSDRQTGTTVPGLAPAAGPTTPGPSDAASDPAPDGEAEPELSESTPTSSASDSPSPSPTETPSTSPSPTLVTSPSPSPGLTGTPSATTSAVP